MGDTPGYRFSDLWSILALLTSRTWKILFWWDNLFSAITQLLFVILCEGIVSECAYRSHHDTNYYFLPPLHFRGESRYMVSIGYMIRQVHVYIRSSVVKIRGLGTNRLVFQVAQTS